MASHKGYPCSFSIFLSSNFAVLQYHNHAVLQYYNLAVLQSNNLSVLQSYNITSPILTVSLTLWMEKLVFIICCDVTYTSLHPVVKIIYQIQFRNIYNQFWDTLYFYIIFLFVVLGIQMRRIHCSYSSSAC